MARPKDERTIPALLLHTRHQRERVIWDCFRKLEPMQRIEAIKDALYFLSVVGIPQARLIMEEAIHARASSITPARVPTMYDVE